MGKEAAVGDGHGLGEEDCAVGKEGKVKGRGGPLLERGHEGIQDEGHASDLGIVGSNHQSWG